MDVSTLPFPNPTNDAQYATDLDVDIGSPYPVPGPVLAVTSAFVQSESPTFPGWNGLGTELQLPGSKPDPSNTHVYDYVNLQQGLDAAVDELAGKGPQTTALDPKFVKDVKTGTASATTLVDDIRAGNWDGSPDDYDANAIVAKLKGTNFSVAGSSGAPGTTSASTSTPATTTGFDWNPLSWPGKVIGSATSSIAGDIGTYILKGVLTLMGAGMIVYGTTLLTSRSGSGPVAASGLAGDASGAVDDIPLAAAAA